MAPAAAPKKPFALYTLIAMHDPSSTLGECPATPAASINRTAAIHRCSRPYSNSRGTDAWGHHGPCDRPRPQHDTGPYDAPDGVGNVLAIHNGTGVFSACGHESNYQQRR